jgi:squalene synthase HpnC
MPVEHYENFPVASILLPRRLRRPVELIYAFARQADDFADEGDLPDATRLALLEGFRTELHQIATGVPSENPLFRDLAGIIIEYRLPLQLFHDLLDAFSQDVVKKRYADFTELMDYCRRSANPVGRLLLHLYNETSPTNLAYSDAICSSLQLINFWQDVAIDYAMDRVYLPQDELARFGVTEQQIARADSSGNWPDLMLFQIERTTNLLQSGAPLGKILRGRIGLEMRMIIAGGSTILRKLEQSGGDVFRQRPILHPKDWLTMIFHATTGR